MIHHVDLGSVLRRSVSDLYTNLVTRPTGAAVRAEIQSQLAAESQHGRHVLAIIDFAHVGLLDYSCADEVVAKLLLPYATPTAAIDAYFVLRGAQEAHVHAIEAAIDRYGLALVAQGPSNDAHLLGAVPDEERKVWDAAYRLGATDADGIAAYLATDGHATTTTEGLARTLDALLGRRLMIRVRGSHDSGGHFAQAQYVAVGRAEYMTEFLPSH